ncbi:hypothetical protein B0H13DRAFT_2317412 [Mycena leptocephala]|nr:hypothetical protein B0H13DRAFT_2317412 [Mycena leptocephala]
MAIDPRLLGALSPSSPSPSPLAPSPTIPSQRPVPRPTYVGSTFGKSNTDTRTAGEQVEPPPSTTNVGGFNFPAISTGTTPIAGSYKPSILFEAFRRSGGSEVPLPRTPIRTPLHTPTTSTGARAASATKSAEVLAGIIGAPSPGPSIFGASRRIALPSTMGPIVGVKRPLPPTDADFAPIADPTDASADAAAPSVNAPGTVVLPGSRPAMRPPKEKKVPAAKKAPGAKAGKKAAVAKAGKKEAAAVSAQKTAEVVKRGRGRPRKEAGGGESSGGAAQLADVTNAPAAPPPLVSGTAANAPPALVSTMGHETRDFNRAVDQRRAVEAAERAAQKERRTRRRWQSRWREAGSPRPTPPADAPGDHHPRAQVEDVRRRQRPRHAREEDATSRRGPFRDRGHPPRTLSGVEEEKSSARRNHQRKGKKAKTA